MALMHAITTHFAACPDHDRTQHRDAGSEQAAVANRWMPLRRCEDVFRLGEPTAVAPELRNPERTHLCPPQPAAAAQRHVVQHRDVVADDRRLTYHHSLRKGEGSAFSRG